VGARPSLAANLVPKPPTDASFEDWWIGSLRHCKISQRIIKEQKRL